MKIFVTGGTGVVGQGAVTALVNAGHEVRLFSRHADDEVRAWPAGVEAWPGSVTDPGALRDAADGCEVVLHVVGIVRETPPESTFEKVNVDGTRNVVAEAERSGARRLVYVSSLGADLGESAYHQSKKRGEDVVRGFGGEWVIVRPGNVYGPGDDVISLLLKMVRVLPAVPVIDGGEHEFQPIWEGDLARALVGAVERDDVVGRTLELAGPDVTCMNDLIDRLAALTDRRVLRVPMPGFLASIGAKLGETLGVDTPITVDQIQMLEERNLIEDPADNALTSVFDVVPTSLDDGLKKLADALPEQLPDEGTGSLTRRRVWADIVGSAYTAEELFDRFCRRFSEITPWHMEVGVEPGTPKEPREGETLTMRLPVRGNIQVRVEELTPRRMTLVTLEGHPLSGAVRFRCEPRGDDLRFEILVHDRPSNIADWLMMSTVGGALQRATWVSTVEQVVKESGGKAPAGVQHESESVRGDDAEPIEGWLKEMVVERKRADRETKRGPQGSEARR